MPITQALLNEHVLPIHASTPGYPAVVNFGPDAKIGIGAAPGGPYRCLPDALSSTPNTKWPHGSCCNGGGACSPVEQNVHRFVINAAPTTGITSYEVALQLPAGVTCDRCVLQWSAACL